MPVKKSTSESVNKKQVAKEKQSDSKVEKDQKLKAQKKNTPVGSAAKKTANVPAKKKVTSSKETAPKKQAAKKAVPSAKKTAVKKDVENSISIKPLVEFRLRFHTKFGQSLYLIKEGEGNIDNATPLHFLDNEYWAVTIQNNYEIIRYQYVLKHIDGSLEFDWGIKTFDPSIFTSKDILVTDSWNHAGYFENVFYTEPFQEVLFGKTAFSQTVSPKNFTHRFIVKAPLLKEGEVVCLLGHGDTLTRWNISAPILMNKRAEEDFWSVELDLYELPHIEYKYGIFNIATNIFVRYEEGANRIAHRATAADQQVSVNDGFIFLPANTWKGAGVAIPVFSLRTERSFGVGEFTDMRSLIDWAKQIGLKLIQILPVNDTSATLTSGDSYPYAAISAFALHPIYLDLEKMTDVKNQHLFEKLSAKRKELNAATTLIYDDVIKTKLQYIEQIFPLQKAATFRKKDFKEFFTANEHWLVPYAVFCYLRDEYGTSDFNQWDTYNQFNENEIAALAKNTIHDKVNIHFFIQYHLHLQLKEVAEYAHKNNIILKGDIPIGIYRYGADAWQQPELYHMNVQAGAPPDDFAVKGQNWGFPTYNWERMKQDGFKWWKQRFEQMSYYFDAFRIDHILGFFRIWSIPLDAVEGIMGRFVPAIAVDVNEFAERGIDFDYNRYCRPYITQHILKEIFGERADDVKKDFLKEVALDQYALKDEFKTQKLVEKYFEGRDEDVVKEGLYDLISNVILFEEEGSQATKFHFRFGIEETSSFKAFDQHTQQQLKHLYVNYFFERQDHNWKNEAMQKLPGLKRATNMLICGEDLGLVPHSVPAVMQELGILSLEIQRMPKAVQKQFFNPADAPYLSVVTPSTHDMSTIRGWWEEDKQTTQQFYNNELNQPGEAPSNCEPWINNAVIQQHLYSPAMWSIFQLQDLLGISDVLRRSDASEERINIPANPKHYWNYRMHLNIEDLVNADEFNTELKEYIQNSGRN